MFGWHNVAVADMEEREECIHQAYLDPDEKWNGWACPYFEEEEVEQMSEWLPEFDDSLVYVEDEDAYVSTYDPARPESFEGCDIDGMHLYPIGYGSWTWVIVD